MNFSPDFKLSVLMPVYNERNTIQEVIARVQAVAIPKEIIIVDDGSTDGTREILRSEVIGKWDNVQVVFHEQNQGKGAAVRTAILHVTGTISIIQDADLETDPNDYFKLIAPILADETDVVYGSRFLNSKPQRITLSYIGNRVLTTISNLFGNQRLTDMETCYKVMRSGLLKSLPLRAKGFEIEPELTMKLARAKMPIQEVPISYQPRTHVEGKKIGWRDAVQAIRCIIRYRFRD